MEYGINVYHCDDVEICFVDWNTQEWFATEDQRDQRLAELRREAAEEELHPKHRLRLDVKTYTKIEKQIAQNLKVTVWAWFRAINLAVLKH